MAASAEASNSSSTSHNNTTDIHYECYDLAYIKTVGTVISVIVFLVGLPLNTSLLFLFAKSLWVGMVTSDIFSLNATLIQTLYCLAYPLIVIGLYFVNQRILKITIFVNSLMTIGWPLFQSCTCVKRYLAVVHPVVFLKISTPKYLKYRVMGSAAIWLTALVFCYIFMSSNPNFPIEVLIGPFILMLVLNSFCSLSIMRALKRPAPGDSEREGMHKMNRQAFRMVLITQLMMTLNFLPYIFSGILKYGGLSEDQICISYVLSFSFIGVTTVIQPMLSVSRMPPSRVCPCLNLEQTG